MAGHLEGAEPLSEPRLEFCKLDPKLNFNQNSNIFIEENASENVACEMLSISSRPQCVKGYIFWFFPVIMLLINQLSCMKIHGDFIWKDNCLIFKEKKIFKILAKVKPHHHSIDKIYFHYYTLYYLLKAMGINVFNQLLLDILCFSSTKLFQKFPQYHIIRNPMRKIPVASCS